MSKTWFWLIMSLVFFGLIFLLRPILPPFVTAALLAYISNPLVDYFVSLKIPRTLAVVLVFIIIFTTLALLILLFIPLLERQLVTLINMLPALLKWLQTTIVPWIMAHFNIESWLEGNNWQELLQQHWQKAGGIAFNIFAVVSKSGFTFLLWIFNLLLTFVVTFYLLRDWEQFIRSTYHLLPRDIAPTAARLTRESDEVIGAFFRGQLLVMISLGAIYSVGLWMSGLKNMALLIGMISGLVSIVPYLGFITGIVLAMVVGLFQFQHVSALIPIGITYLIGQILESTVLTPILVGDRIGLHPIAVIFAILAGGQLFGFVGVLLALPFAAVLKVVLHFMMTRYLASDLYKTPSNERIS